MSRADPIVSRVIERACAEVLLPETGAETLTWQWTSDGASIKDENSTNGTYVNDDRVLAGAEVRLVDGDRVRLAADVSGDVSLPQGEPDPCGLSRNGRS
jgi:hypothetical protein